MIYSKLFVGTPAFKALSCKQKEQPSQAVYKLCTRNSNMYLLLGLWYQTETVLKHSVLFSSLLPHLMQRKDITEVSTVRIPMAETKGTFPFSSL